MLTYVFGYLTDWESLLEATRRSNLPAYVAITFVDKVLFFLVWTMLQVTAIRRLVGPVPIRPLLALRGGSEILRAVSNQLADGAFYLGLIHMTGGHPGRVLIAATIPTLVHTVVLVGQVTVVLPFLEGGFAGNPELVTAAGIGWAAIAATALALRLVRRGRWRRLAWLRARLETLDFRAFTPMLGWFVFLALADITIQWLGTSAFGVPVGWLPLAGRLPLLYMALSLPSFGNYGTRELAWAYLFRDYGDRSGLIAYAIATNTLFLVFNVMIGVLFLPRAVALVRELLAARRAGEPLPRTPLVRDREP